MSEAKHSGSPWTCRSPDGTTFADHPPYSSACPADLDDYDIDEDERCGTTASLAVKDSAGRVVALVVMAGGGTERDERHNANARLIAAAPDHALVARQLCSVTAPLTWRPWGDGRGELCYGGFCYVTAVDEFGVPMLTDHLRSKLVAAAAK